MVGQCLSLIHHGKYACRCSGNRLSLSDAIRLLAINGVSLVSALVANAALLLNMANRARFEIAQPITVLGFYLSAFLLIGLLAAASVKSFYNPGAHALSGAFYYGIWAAVLYTSVASLMLLTVWAALTGRSEKHFSLTTSQRTLMLQTISFMFYLLFGAFVYSQVEGWQYLDAVYWADFTLLTIGIGSPLTPMTHTGRCLLIPYAIGGIITVGLIIGSIRSMLLDTGKEKMKQRAIEKMRGKVHSYADVQLRRLKPLVSSKKRPEDDDLPVKERRRQEFHAMRAILQRAAGINRWTSLLLSTSAAALLWFVGALIFMLTEYKQGWTYFVSLYFSYTSLLTIGYGDYSPMSNSGRAFFVLWSLMAIPTLTVLISDMGDTVVKGIADFTIWVGNLTILPSQAGTWRDWVDNVKRLKERISRKRSNHSMEMDSRVSTADLQGLDLKGASRDMPMVLRDRLSQRESNHCSTLSSDRQFFAWLLVREVSTLLADKCAPKVRTYNYNEWSYFLTLLGHDEHDPELHRRPNPPSRRGSTDTVQLGRPIDQHGNIKPWSWIGTRSPLMSPKDEVDWLLQHLLARLQREVSSRYRTDQTQLPVTLSMIASINGSTRDPDGNKKESPEDG